MTTCERVPAQLIRTLRRWRPGLAARLTLSVTRALPGPLRRKVTARRLRPRRRTDAAIRDLRGRRMRSFRRLRLERSTRLVAVRLCAQREGEAAAPLDTLRGAGLERAKGFSWERTARELDRMLMAQLNAETSSGFAV